MVEQWVINTSILIAIPIIGYIANVLRLKGKKAKEINIISKANAAEIKLLKKALIIVLKRIDKQVEKEHGEDPELACLVKDLLSDTINGRKI